MDHDHSKRIEWFRRTLFQDEPLKRPSSQPAVSLPSALKAARSLEAGVPRSWQSRDALFVKQGKLLAHYVDDYVYDQPVRHYYPTYQDLSDGELRGYFTWRTKLRCGEFDPNSPTYIYLYLYELLNLITVDTPMEGFEALIALRDGFLKDNDRICSHVNRWLVDFAVYHDLDPQLLKNLPQMELDQQVLALLEPQNHSVETVMDTILTFAPKWLNRSRFYADYKTDMDQIIPKVLQGIVSHYAKGKRPFIEQLFGVRQEHLVRLFDSAVFFRSQTPAHCQYILNPICTYQRHNHFWTVSRYAITKNCPKLESFLKTIDAVMRQCYDYGHPIQPGADLQWLVKLTHQETLAYLEQKKQAEARKLHLDFSQLDTIRRNAQVTCEALLVEEERLEAPEDTCVSEGERLETSEELSTAEPEATSVDTPLDAEEYRLLQCLLYGGDLNWVRTGGLMISVLIDGINDKLYDTFLDSVVENDPPQVIEDYLSDLKEMIKP